MFVRIYVLFIYLYYMMIPPPPLPTHSSLGALWILLGCDGVVWGTKYLEREREREALKTELL